MAVCYADFNMLYLRYRPMCKLLLLQTVYQELNLNGTSVGSANICREVQYICMKFDLLLSVNLCCK
jgi:hypothetical protein